MNPSDDNDALWKLLGQARQPKVSPFFARNVVREIRGSRREQPGFFGLLIQHWRFTVAGAAVGCLAAIAAFQFVGNASQSRQIDSLVAITEQISDSPDFYVINDLDDLLASEESSIWLDNSVH
ncbi:MAG: hypothetical protein ABIZ56_09275 [Chthoniobacteraceae bacterium]